MRTYERVIKTRKHAPTSLHIINTEFVCYLDLFSQKIAFSISNLVQTHQIPLLLFNGCTPEMIAQPTAFP